MVRPVRVWVGLVEGGDVRAAVDEEVRGEREQGGEVVGLEDAQGEAGGQRAQVGADDHQELKGTTEKKNNKRAFFEKYGEGRFSGLIGERERKGVYGN